VPNSYVQLPIETQPELLAADSFDYLTDKTDGRWTPSSDAQLDVWLISAVARQAAELRDVASDVPSAIFRYFGAALLGLQPLDAQSATVTVTINVRDTTGYTIPSGYTVGIRDSSGAIWGFKTTQDVVVPAGTSSAPSIVLTATTEGADSSNLGAAAQPMELVTALDYVTSVVMASATGGGQDAEDDDAYLNRLALNMALQAPRPILPGDFAAFALNTPGVARALAIDGYDVNLATYNNARTVTVAVVDVNGNPVGTPIKNAVQAALVAQRETNFVVYVIDPSYTTIDVQYSAIVFPGYDPVAVGAGITAAIRAFLNPGTWGQPQVDAGEIWSNRNVIKQGTLDAIVGSVRGVKDVNPTLFRTGAGAFSTADLALAGVAPLPLPGSVTGTVV
jgi:hypothetical protein